MWLSFDTSRDLCNIELQACINRFMCAYKASHSTLYRVGFHLPNKYICIGHICWSLIEIITSDFLWSRKLRGFKLELWWGRQQEKETSYLLLYTFLFLSVLLRNYLLGCFFNQRIIFSWIFAQFFYFLYNFFVFCLFFLWSSCLYVCVCVYTHNY